MKLALIPPISLIGLTETTHYQLMLPHLLQNETYAEEYRELCEDPEQYVILDNGVAEGQKIDIFELAEIIDTFDPDEFVLPDVLRDSQKTLDASELALDFLIEQDMVGTALMYVCQGKSIDEFVANAIEACHRLQVDCIGIPRHAIETCNDVLARVEIANQLQDYKTWRTKIHFLGGSRIAPNEIERLTNPEFTTQRWLRGIDTSMPFNFAYHGKYMLDDPVHISRPDGYFHQKAMMFNRGALSANIQYMLAHVREGS